MSGTYEGVLRTAASRLGIPVSVYRVHVAAGRKWCYACRRWQPRDDFVVDRSRGDGLKAKCLAADRGQPRFPRDPKKEAARKAVARAVRDGRLPKANAVPCSDCGHKWKEGERRHEYDHARGYARAHRLHVDAVCTLCHADREKARRE